MTTLRLLSEVGPLRSTQLSKDEASPPAQSLAGLAAPEGAYFIAVRRVLAAGFGVGTASA